MACDTFLKGLGMQTANPCPNWRICQRTLKTELWFQKCPIGQNEWADVSPLLKNISGASRLSRNAALYASKNKSLTGM